jgi:hypothetical protein
MYKFKAGELVQATTNEGFDSSFGADPVEGACSEMSCHFIACALLVPNVKVAAVSTNYTTVKQTCQALADRVVNGRLSDAGLLRHFGLQSRQTFDINFDDSDDVEASLNDALAAINGLGGAAPQCTPILLLVPQHAIVFVRHLGDGKYYVFDPNLGLYRYDTVGAASKDISACCNAMMDDMDQNALKGAYILH